MKNLYSAILTLMVVIIFGLACQNNPLSKLTKKYSCTIAGEPEPTTSEDFYYRAVKHTKVYSGDDATSLDDCAFAALDEALRLDPNNYKALFLRGFGHKQRNEIPSAMADLGKAIEVNPKYHEAFYQRSKIYAKDREYQKAIQDMNNAIDFAPKDYFLLEDYYFDRADYYFQSSQFEKALADLDEAIKFNYHSEIYLKKRAEIYRKLGKNDLAEEDERAAEIWNPKTIPPNSNTQNTKNLPKSVSGGIVNGKAVNLVKPIYPPAAKAVRAKGVVNVQVTIDENGSVVSANAVSGHPLLRPAAESAARSSKFSPTMLSGQKVKVTGVIVFNFDGES